MKKHNFDKRIIKAIMVAHSCKYSQALHLYCVSLGYRSYQDYLDINKS